jgi:hypothetical protein
MMFYARAVEECANMLDCIKKISKKVSCAIVSTGILELETNPMPN